MKEGEKYDKKSLSTITGKNPGWKEIAKDCVGFANARGGIIAIGIEDKEDDAELFEDKMSKLTSELGVLFLKSHGLEEQIHKTLGGLGYEF